MDSKYLEQEVFCEFLSIYETVINFIGGHRVKQNISYFNSLLKLTIVIIASTLCYTAIQNKSIELLAFSAAIATFSTFSFIKLVKATKILNDEFEITFAKFDSFSKNVTLWTRVKNGRPSYSAALKVILDLKRNCFYSFSFTDFNELVLWNGAIYFSNAICLVACNWLEDCSNSSVVQILLLFELVVLISEYLLVTQRTKRRTIIKNEELRNTFECFTTKLKKLTSNYSKNVEHYIESNVDIKPSSESKTVFEQRANSDDSVDNLDIVGRTENGPVENGRSEHTHRDRQNRNTVKSDPICKFIDERKKIIISQTSNSHTCLLPEINEVDKQKGTLVDDFKNLDCFESMKNMRTEIENHEETAQNDSSTKENAEFKSSSDGNRADGNTEVSVSTSFSFANDKNIEKKNVHTDYFTENSGSNIIKEDAEVSKIKAVEESSQNHEYMNDQTQLSCNSGNNMMIMKDDAEVNKTKAVEESSQNHEHMNDQIQGKVSFDVDSFQKQTGESNSKETFTPEINEEVDQQYLYKGDLNENLNSNKDTNSCRVKPLKDKYSKGTIRNFDSRVDNKEYKLNCDLIEPENIIKSANSSSENTEVKGKGDTFKGEFSENCDFDESSQDSQANAEYEEHNKETLQSYHTEVDIDERNLTSDTHKGGEHVDESPNSLSVNVEVNEQQNIPKGKFSKNFEFDRSTENSQTKVEKDRHIEEALVKEKASSFLLNPNTVKEKDKLKSVLNDSKSEEDIENRSSLHKEDGINNKADTSLSTENNGIINQGSKNNNISEGFKNLMQIDDKTTTAKNQSKMEERLPNETNGNTDANKSIITEDCDDLTCLGDDEKEIDTGNASEDVPPEASKTIDERDDKTSTLTNENQSKLEENLSNETNRNKDADKVITEENCDVLSSLYDDQNERDTGDASADTQPLDKKPQVDEKNDKTTTLTVENQSKVEEKLSNETNGNKDADKSIIEEDYDALSSSGGDENERDTGDASKDSQPVAKKPDEKNDETSTLIAESQSKVKERLSNETNGNKDAGRPIIEDDCDALSSSGDDENERDTGDASEDSQPVAKKPDEKNGETSTLIAESQSKMKERLSNETNRNRDADKSIIEEDCDALSSWSDEEIERDTNDASEDSQPEASKISFNNVESDSARLNFDQSGDSSLSDQSDDSRVSSKSDDSKERDQFDASRVRDQSDDSEVRVQFDDSRVKDQSEDFRVRDQSDDSRVRDQSDDSRVKDQSDYSTVRDQFDDTRVKDQSDDTRVRDQSDDFNLKDAKDAYFRKHSIESCNSEREVSYGVDVNGNERDFDNCFELYTNFVPNDSPKTEAKCILDKSETACAAIDTCNYESFENNQNTDSPNSLVRQSRRPETAPACDSADSKFSEDITVREDCDSSTRDCKNLHTSQSECFENDQIKDFVDPSGSKQKVLPRIPEMATECGIADNRSSGVIDYKDKNRNAKSNTNNFKFQSEGFDTHIRHNVETDNSYDKSKSFVETNYNEFSSSNAFSTKQMNPVRQFVNGKETVIQTLSASRHHNNNENVNITKDKIKLRQNLFDLELDLDKDSDIKLHFTSSYTAKKGDSLAGQYYLKVQKPKKQNELLKKK